MWGNWSRLSRPLPVSRRWSWVLTVRNRGHAGSAHRGLKKDYPAGAGGSLNLAEPRRRQDAMRRMRQRRKRRKRRQRRQWQAHERARRVAARMLRRGRGGVPDDVQDRDRVQRRGEAGTPRYAQDAREHQRRRGEAGRAAGAQGHLGGARRADILCCADHGACAVLFFFVRGGFFFRGRAGGGAG